MGDLSVGHYRHSEESDVKTKTCVRRNMNTGITIHPNLQHYGLTTGNLDAMVDWYRKVLGMTINHRSAAPPACRA